MEFDLYFMIIYLCMKYESNRPIHSKDMPRNHIFVRTGVMLYAPPPPPLKMTEA